MRDDNYYSGKEKNNTLLIVILTVLIMLVLGLGGYIVYDKVVKKEELPSIGENDNENDLEKNDSDINENGNDLEKNDSDINENLNLTKTEKIEYNKEIKNIWFSLYRVLSTNKNFDLNKLKSGENLIKTKSDKMEFLWELISRDESINKNKDSNGTGSISLKTTDFIMKYKELFNEELTESDIKNKYTIKNNIVYGEYYTGFVNEFMLKTQKLNKIDNNTYQLQTDFVVLENDADAFLECSDESITSCNKSAVYGNLLIEYGSLEDNNYLISITFKK